jgi:hypothetical protein
VTESSQVLKREATDAVAQASLDARAAWDAVDDLMSRMSNLLARVALVNRTAPLWIDAASAHLGIEHALADVDPAPWGRALKVNDQEFRDAWKRLSVWVEQATELIHKVSVPMKPPRINVVDNVALRRFGFTAYGRPVDLSKRYRREMQRRSEWAASLGGSTTNTAANPRPSDT